MKMKEELKYLVIDTSLENITSLNLFIGNKSTDIIYDESRAHLKNLIPGIKEILERSNLKISDLSFISINEGPGSWTGLRIGFATVKVFAYINKIPLITYNNFEIILHKNKILNGLMLIKSSHVNYYFSLVNEGEVTQKGIIPEVELLLKFPNLEKFYLEEDLKLIEEVILQKFKNGNFANIFDIEPDYITEGLIISKFEK